MSVLLFGFELVVGLVVWGLALCVGVVAEVLVWGLELVVESVLKIGPGRRDISVARVVRASWRVDGSEQERRRMVCGRCVDVSASMGARAFRRWMGVGSGESSGGGANLLALILAKRGVSACVVAVTTDVVVFGEL